MTPNRNSVIVVTFVALTLALAYRFYAKSPPLASPSHKIEPSVDNDKADTNYSTRPTSRDSVEHLPATSPDDAKPESDAARIHVLDESGSPIANANCHIFTQESELPRVEVVSSPTGQASLPAGHPIGPARILVTHDEYQPRESHESISSDSLVEITLIAAAEIEGIVVADDGTIPPYPVNVLAYPDGYTPTLDSIFRSMRGVPSIVRLARSDETGYFRLAGLNPAQQYTLSAATGMGYCSRAPLSGISPRSDTAKVVVYPLFGFHAKLVDQEGSRIPFDLRLWPPSGHVPGPSWTWSGGPAEPLPTHSVEGILCGLDLRLTERAPHSEVAGLFTADSATARVGPIRLEGTPCGFSPFTEELWAEPVRGALPATEIRLEQTAEDFGSAFITLAGVPAGCAYGSSTHIGASAQLEFRNEHGEVFVYLLGAVGSDVLEVKGLPFGSYKVGIKTKAGFLGYESPDVALVGDEPGEAVIDMTLFRSVDVEVIQGGKPYAGFARFEVFYDTGSRRRREHFAFSRSPYRIAGLLPKVYEIKVARPFFTPDPTQVSLLDTSMEDCVRSVTLTKP